jgi:anti-sigma-K factor RskA
LAPAERRAFDQRLGGEPALRRLVAEWHEGFVTLADGIAPVTPPAELKRQIDALLFPARGAERGSRLSLGRLIFGGLSAALAVLAVVAILPFLSPTPVGPVYQAQIATEDSTLVVLASLDTSSRELTVQRSVGAPAAGRSLELWLIAPDVPAPISLGVIDPAQTTLTVPEDLVARFQGGTLAISDEPEGGSPTGSPTNVLGAGPVTLL